MELIRVGVLSTCSHSHNHQQVMRGRSKDTPIVQLSDPAEDVRYILQALFRRKYMAFGGKLPFAVLADIQQLLIEMQQGLLDVPTALAGFDAWQANWTAVEEEDVRVRLSPKIGLVSIPLSPEISAATTTHRRTQ